MKITKLAYQKKDQNRVNVYVDGEFAVGLEVNDIVRLGLYDGQEIIPEELNKIIGESEFGKLFNAALNFLSFRPRSEWEIRNFLLRKIKNTGEKQKNADTIGTVLDKLKEIGQVNDEEFARWYIGQRRTFRPKGRRAMEMELRRKGIASNTIKQLSSNSISELDLARRAVEKIKNKIERIREKEGEAVAAAKVQRFLASRGFGWETIKEVVAKILPREYNGEEG